MPGNCVTFVLSPCRSPFLGRLRKKLSVGRTDAACDITPQASQQSLVIFYGSSGCTARTTSSRPYLLLCWIRRRLSCLQNSLEPCANKSAAPAVKAESCCSHINGQEVSQMLSNALKVEQARPRLHCVYLGILIFFAFLCSWDQWTLMCGVISTTTYSLRRTFTT